MITLPGTGQKVSSRIVGDEHYQAMIPEDPFITRIEEASSTVTYIGKALPGTPTSSAGWQIKKITSTSETIVQFADGDLALDNIWDNRASLTYS